MDNVRNARATGELEELITALALGVDDHDLQGLTFAQKELFADILDRRHAAADLADGYGSGHPLAYEPVDRWWRTAALPPASPRVHRAPTAARLAEGAAVSAAILLGPRTPVRAAG